MRKQVINYSLQMVGKSLLDKVFPEVFVLDSPFDGDEFSVVDFTGGQSEPSSHCFLIQSNKIQPFKSQKNVLSSPTL